mmetsp:Transcript_36139/g.92378  ORF Transcript_36139/g.92378 Transcript_36139/m.92378 type:complete len:228 (+) Transcript_36139:133-816(+)
MGRVQRLADGGAQRQVGHQLRADGQVGHGRRAPLAEPLGDRGALVRVAVARKHRVPHDLLRDGAVVHVRQLVGNCRQRGPLVTVRGGVRRRPIPRLRRGTRTDGALARPQGAARQRGRRALRPRPGRAGARWGLGAIRAPRGTISRRPAYLGHGDAPAPQLQLVRALRCSITARRRPRELRPGGQAEQAGRLGAWPRAAPLAGRPKVAHLPQAALRGPVERAHHQRH